jgi:predicted PurR-regulated permease PerM
MNADRFRLAFLILLVAAISVAFVAMVRMFLLTILLAAIFAAMARPLYVRLQGWLWGRQALAAAATLVLMLTLVFAPLAGMVGIVTREAIRVTRNVRPWIQAAIDEPSLFDAAVQRFPFLGNLEPYREQIITRAGELVGTAGTFLADALSAATTGTVVFIFHFFILLYSMYFFLTDGPRMLGAVMRYLPLGEDDKQRMLDKFTSVARATLKGTALIGILQGVLSGIAFWMVGIDGAAFWATLMIVLSIIPGIGGALVWVPATVVLIVQGEIWRGVGLALFCGLVVGSVDNLLRPRLVGRDTKMHDLLILFSTLGGIALFGVTGFIVGPILAALFITVWEMFGTAFRNVLREQPPPTEGAGP